MSSRIAKAAVAVAAIAIGAYWYWSPFAAIHSMQSAAETRDADAFNEYVDYPKLRESIKGQFSAMMTEVMGASRTRGTEMERAGAALGSMLGLALADRMVDAMVRPEAVMRAMQSARLEDKPAPFGTGPAEKKRNVKWDYERKGLDKLIAYAADEAGSTDDRVGFVFERSGFATWKLIEIRLPARKP